MEQPIKTRKAILKDVDTIFSYISHLEETSFDFAAFKERYRENLEKEDCLYEVAVNDHDEVIGFISCHGQTLLHHDGKVFEIQEMYVARNFRGRGIGKALFAVVEEKLAELDCESLEVATNIMRTDAKKFYTKLGFVQTHVEFVKEL